METLNDKNPKVRRLQLEELEILKAVRDFCDQRKIKYYLAFGTLLGAVRHEGFIPWDDDIDIFMMRKDYNLFFSEAEDALPSWLQLKTYHNSNYGEESIHLTGKVEATNRYVYKEIGDKITKQRIWIDVFPLDGLPRTKPLVALHWKNLQFHYKLCLISRAAYGYDKTVKRRLIPRIGLAALDHTKIRQLFPVEKTHKAMERVLRLYPYDHSDKVLGLAYEYGKKCFVPRKCFGEGKKVAFEGEWFNAPEDPETLLTQWYGNYMQLPPIEKQVVKHCVEIIT